MSMFVANSRVPCPNITQFGSCGDVGCSYNHNAYTAPSFVDINRAKTLQENKLTGSSGEYLGTRKGPNSIPVKQSGDIPDFLRARFERSGQQSNTPMMTPEINTVRPGVSSLAPAPPKFNNPGFEFVERRGNTVPLREAPAIARIPVQRENRPDANPIDWKAVALSKVRERTENGPRKAQLEAQLRSLMDQEAQKVQHLKKLEDEIKTLQRAPRHTVDPQLVQSASMGCASVCDRSEAHAATAEEEHQTISEVFRRMESTGLVDLSDAKRMERQILLEIAAGYDRLNRLCEHVGTEFRLLAYKAQKIS